jgi:hypothetical protein
MGLFLCEFEKIAFVYMVETCLPSFNPFLLLPSTVIKGGMVGIVSIRGNLSGGTMVLGTASSVGSPDGMVEIVASIGDSGGR